MSRKDLQDAAARGLFADEISSAPDYLGHRERLRERFHASGGESLQDYELLELFLFGVIPRRDTKPIAKALLARFGSFGEVISAPVEALCEVDGIGETTATSLKAVQAAAQRLLQTRVKDEPLISSWSELIAYCTAQMAYNPIEQFCLTYVATLHFDCGFVGIAHGRSGSIRASPWFFTWPTSFETVHAVMRLAWRCLRARISYW